MTVVPKTINDLPDDVLVRVLVDCYPQNFAVTRVCRRWRALCTSDEGVVLKKTTANLTNLPEQLPDEGRHAWLVEKVRVWKDIVKYAIVSLPALVPEFHACYPRLQTGGRFRVERLPSSSRLAVQLGIDAMRSLYRLRLRKFEDLQVLAGALAGNPWRDEKALRTLGEERLCRGEPVQAIAYLERCWPSTTWHRHETRVSCYVRVGRVDEARRLVEEHPDLVDDWEISPVETLLSVGLVQQAEERAERDLAREDLIRFPEKRREGLETLRDYYAERDPARADALRERIATLFSSD